MSSAGPDIKHRLQADIETAMRGRNRARLSALRLVMAAIKQREVDDRAELEDAGIVAVLEKMSKQRRDALAQFEAAGRDDLAEQERFELAVISQYLPQALTPEALAAEIDRVFAELAPTSMKDMGRVMGALQSRLRGRADLGAVSAEVKSRLAG